MAEIRLINSSGIGGATNIDVNFNGTLEGTADATIPLNVNLTDSIGDVTPTSVALTGNDLDILIPDAIIPSGVLFKTIQPSQYTSYRTGDEGWRVQNGWFDYTPPTSPKAIAELDFTNANMFSILKNPLVVNGVSSTTRFVDINGIQAFSATGNANLATIDKLTGLMYYRFNPPVTDWNTAIDNSLAFTLTLNGITYSDWYVTTNKELLNTVHNYAGISVLNDPATGVLLWPNNFNYWTSTTYADGTTLAWFYANLTRGLGSLIKTDLRNSYYVTNARNLITAP
jgi:hypothetical protein